MSSYRSSEAGHWDLDWRRHWIAGIAQLRRPARQLLHLALLALPIAPWELKKDRYRIFYDIIDTTVDILAIGYKDHNDLFICGRRISI